MQAVWLAWGAWLLNCRLQPLMEHICDCCCTPWRAQTKKPVPRKCSIWEIRALHRIHGTYIFDYLNNGKYVQSTQSSIPTEP